MRARDRARADLGAALQVPRRPPDPAHGVHQQARHRVGAGQRGAGGAAVGLAAPAGAAPGAAAAAPRAPSPAMSISSASAPIATSPASPPTSSSCPRIARRGARRPAPAWSRSSPISTTSCWSSCSRTCSPRRRRSTAISTQDLRRDLIVPVFLGAAPARSRRAPPAEGAAPRDAGGGRHRGAPRPRSRERRHRGAGDQDLSSRRIPASCRWPGSGAARSARA